MYCLSKRSVQHAARVPQKCSSRRTQVWKRPYLLIKPPGTHYHGSLVIRHHPCTLTRPSLLHKFTAPPQPSPPRKRKREAATSPRRSEAGSSKGRHIAQKRVNSRTLPDSLSEGEESEPSTPEMPTSTGAYFMYILTYVTNAEHVARNPLVECPMCSQYVPMDDINRHMDSNCTLSSPQKPAGKAAWKGLLDGKGKDKDATKNGWACFCRCRSTSNDQF